MVAATPRRCGTWPVGVGPCGSSSVSTQFPASPRHPRLAPNRAPICPCLYLCLSITCRNGPIYSTQTQEYNSHIDMSHIYMCTAYLRPTINFSAVSCLYSHHGFLVSDKQSRKITAVCFALKGSVCGWLFCVQQINSCCQIIIFSVSCRSRASPR